MTGEGGPTTVVGGGGERCDLYQKNGNSFDLAFSKSVAHRAVSWRDPQP